MGNNTIEGYVETILGILLPKTFWDKIFKKRYDTKRKECEAKLYQSFENIAKSYHKIAVQNFILRIDNNCKDTANKHTKKLNWTELYKIAESVKFKP